MIVSDKQVQQMFQVLVGSLKIGDNNGTYLPFNDKQRLEIVNAILAQQSEDLVDLTAIEDSKP
jgi:hypothetical protein